MPTNNQLDARLKRVEKELAELKATMVTKQSQPWYREIVGIFEGDKDFAEIARLGRLFRQEKLKG